MWIEKRPKRRGSVVFTPPNLPVSSLTYQFFLLIPTKTSRLIELGFPATVVGMAISVKVI